MLLGAKGSGIGPGKVKGHCVFLCPFLKEKVLRLPSHLSFPWVQLGCGGGLERKPRYGSKTCTEDKKESHFPLFNTGQPHVTIPLTKASPYVVPATEDRQTPLL